MATRFESRKNKPNSQTLTSKRKVLREFQIMQAQLQDIQQEDIIPDGEEFYEDDAPVVAASQERDETPPRGSRILDKVYANEEYFTQKDQELFKTQGDQFRTLQVMSQTRQRKKARHNHKLDPSKFSTINTYHQTQLQPRSTGFIDMNKQMKRPAFTINKAHDHRFQFLDHFPRALSQAKHVPKLRFDKQTSRKDERSNSMSESCFSHDKVDLYKKKAKGTLQFGKSNPGSKNWMPKKMQMTEEVELPIQTIKSPVLKFSQQMPRVPDQDKLNNLPITREERRAYRKLPSHMHNITNSMKFNNTLERTLRESKFQQSNWNDQKSFIANKKTFRQDPTGQHAPVQFDPLNPPKKKMTFAQLLVKFGYITQDKTQDNRKRPWHVAHVNPDGYSSSDDDANVGI